MASAVAKIEGYNKGLDKDMMKRKYDALSESPFRFYRGTCHLFADDFFKYSKTDKKLRSWVCGDAHFENFGSYKGQNRLVYFDVNDFDEAVVGNPEIDLVRFLTSIVIGARQMKAGDKHINGILEAVVSAYIGTLYEGKALMMEKEVAHGILKQYFIKLNARNRDKFIEEHTEVVKRKIQFKYDNVRALPIKEAEKKQIYAALGGLLKTSKYFSDLEFKDVAWRLAGTGSLGLERYSVLCLNKQNGKYYLIDMKRARQSCYKDIVNIKQPKFSSEAGRVLNAAHVMQFCTPRFSTQIKLNRKDFVVKELQPLEDKMTVEQFKKDVKSFSEVCLEFAPLIGYTHVRSGGHNGTATADDLKRFSEKSRWQKDVIDLSFTLAGKNEKYYHQFLDSQSTNKKAAH